MGRQAYTGRVMAISNRNESVVDGGWLAIAALLLIGVLLLVLGSRAEGGASFFAGLAAVLAGVLAGVKKLVLDGAGPRRR